MKTKFFVILIYFLPNPLFGVEVRDGSPSLHRGSFKKGEIELVKPVLIFENKWIQFYNDEVIFPDGRKGTYNRVSRPLLTNEKVSGAAVLPLTSNGEVILEKVFRHPIREWTVEIPRGGYEEKDASLEQTGRRELSEELGYACNSWKDLGQMYPDTGLTGYKVQLFLARDCKKASKITETAEAIKGFLLPWKEFLELAQNGNIKDSISLAAILRAQPYYPTADCLPCGKTDHNSGPKP